MTIIKIITDDDVNKFNRIAPKHEVVMAGFFMVGCPACKQFKPEWETFLKDAEEEEDSNVLIAEVDSNQTSKVDFDTSTLEGFPSVFIKHKKNEDVDEFKDSRTSDSLKNFLKMAVNASKKTRGGRKRRRKKKKTRRAGFSKKRRRGGRKTVKRRGGKRKTRVKRKGDKRRSSRRSIKGAETRL
jgi:hypothetical protein